MSLSQFKNIWLIDTEFRALRAFALRCTISSFEIFERARRLGGEQIS